MRVQHAPREIEGGRVANRALLEQLNHLVLVTIAPRPRIDAEQGDADPKDHAGAPCSRPGPAPCSRSNPIPATRSSARKRCSSALAPEAVRR
jgi:hypothetical protein